MDRLHIAQRWVQKKDKFNGAAKMELVGSIVGKNDLSSNKIMSGKIYEDVLCISR